MNSLLLYYLFREMITTQTLLCFMVRGEQGKDQMIELKRRSCARLVHLLAHVTWFGSSLKLEWMWLVWICHMGTTLPIRKLLILLNNTILNFKIELFPSCLTPRLNYSLHCIAKWIRDTKHDTDTGLTTILLGRVLKLEVGMCHNQFYSKKGRHSILLLKEGLVLKILLVSIMMILSMMSRLETFFSSMVSVCMLLCLYSEIWN